MISLIASVIALRACVLALVPDISATRPSFMVSPLLPVSEVFSVFESSVFSVFFSDVAVSKADP